MPWCASASAVVRPTGPAPTMRTGIMPASYPEETPRGRVQPLEAIARHADQLADLHAGRLIAADDVRLHDDRHVLLQRHVGQRARRAALRADDGREVAAAEAVHQVVARREAAILDDAGGLDDLLHRRAMAHRGGHRIEC